MKTNTPSIPSKFLIAAALAFTACKPSIEAAPVKQDVDQAISAQQPGMQDNKSVTHDGEKLMPQNHYNTSYPTEVRGTWELGPRKCRAPLSDDSTSGLNIGLKSISGYKHTVQILRQEKVSDDPLAWKIDAADNHSGESKETKELFVVSGDSLVITDGIQSKMYSRCPVGQFQSDHDTADPHPSSLPKSGNGRSRTSSYPEEVRGVWRMSDLPGKCEYPLNTDGDGWLEIRTDEAFSHEETFRPLLSKPDEGTEKTWLITAEETIAGSQITRIVQKFQIIDGNLNITEEIQNEDSSGISEYVVSYERCK